MGKVGRKFGHTTSEVSREKMRLARIGKISNNWKGGKAMAGGYVMVHKPEHPFAKKDGYVLEHRLVVEKYIGRYLTKKEEVHHINGNREDNRKINLYLFNSKGEHTSFHNFVKKGYVVLLKCNF
jgi:uncharacterized protein (DUF1330 family)